jgi:beta-phosphoglucomutase-like phosphatase (HAD superfamily)
MNKLYGLIFDVDGVIADTEPVNAKVTIRVFEGMFGLKGVKPEDFTAGIGKGAEKYVKAAADVHGLTLTDEQIKTAAQLREQYLIKAIKEEPLPVFPGVLELINMALQRQDFRLAIATSATLELSRAILESAKVPYQKMVYVNGSEITRKKARPGAFPCRCKSNGHCAEKLRGFRGCPQRRTSRQSRRRQMYRCNKFHNRRKPLTSGFNLRFSYTDKP